MSLYLGEIKKRRSISGISRSRYGVSAERTHMASLQPSSETAAMEGVLAWHPRHLHALVELREADDATLLSDISSTLVLHHRQLLHRVRRRRDAAEIPVLADAFDVPRRFLIDREVGQKYVYDHLDPVARVESRLDWIIAEGNELSLQPPGEADVITIGAGA